ncbi:hypothetical protein INT47_003228 [Mucor saturninus]|uniref:Uncharacterized protein n=1 Tax=Mucor saturninus TaxID=64648 RepID=A0A8H7RGM2_9FUNG|nr:hypothetical protein INT47_003228 [Mucor saturninus]
MTTTNTTKWWWNKKPSPKQISTDQKSVASSINGADEDASMFSLYSYSESLHTPSTINASSSIRAQHTKSEYSGNFSDIESNASILSKPWISRNMIDNKSNKDSVPDDDDDDNSVGSDEQYSYSLPVSNTYSAEDLPDINPKRRGSLVEYIVNKPLHGKLKVKQV